MSDESQVAKQPFRYSTAVHRMMPGSHERRGGPECLCGASWDRWNDRCGDEETP